MARSHHTLRGRVILRSVAVTAVFGCGIALAPTAGAVPGESTGDLTTTQQQVIQMQHDLEVVTEQYNDARVALETQQAAAEQATADLSTAQQQLEDQKAVVAGVSVNLYKGPQMQSMSTVIAGDSPQDVIDKLNTINLLNDHYGGELDKLKAIEQQNIDAKAAADAAAAAAAATEAEIAAKKSSIESELPKLEAKLAELSGPQVQEVLDQAGGHAVPASQSSQAPSAPAVDYSASGAAQGAVQAALSRLGKPYVWGASGPNAFDCSGLTMWAYAQVGISLPHSSGAQSGMGTSVSLSALAPGDIVWMPGHVGLYIGDGKVVHAPTSGDVVKVVALSSMRWSKGVRIA